MIPPATDPASSVASGVSRTIHWATSMLLVPLKLEPPTAADSGPINVWFDGFGNEIEENQDAETVW